MSSLPYFTVLRFALGCLLALVVCGCASRQPVVYYHLTPLATATQSQDTAEPPARLAIGIGPLVLPEALNRAQIAARLDQQSLKYDDSQRWSTPLADDFANVLLEDIAAQLPPQTLAAVFPWERSFQPTHRLLLHVSRFDGQLGAEVELAVRWTITDGSGKEALLDRKSTIRVTTAGDQYADLVTAQSQAVADLSKEIVAALTGR